MRLFSAVLLTTLLVPGLCLAQPEVTDDITNSPSVTPPEQITPQDDSKEVVMPATTVRGLPDENGTLPSLNATLIDENGTLPVYNATLPAENGTMPVYNATLPGVNGTLPVYNATLPGVNGTLPVYNATLPAENGTMPVYNATLPGVNGTLPVYNATLPGSVTVPQVNINATQPVVNVTPPKAISVADFLVKTPGQTAEPVKQERVPAPPKKDPQPPKEQAKKTPAQKEPAQKEPAKTAPKQEPVKQTAQKAKPGQGMKIPPEAAKNGDLSFLEGCWRGYRPEYHSKRMVTERFCFNASGVGKRTIKDPTYAGECYGATRALLNKNGVLHMDSEQAVCTNGVVWGASEMICKGEGEQTPCYWNFTNTRNANQSYKISFVRE